LVESDIKEVNLFTRFSRDAQISER